MSTAAALDHDLSPAAVELLRAGAADNLGYCCSPGSVVKNWPAISEAKKRGYLRFLGEHPWITDKGRKAIGAPTETEAGRLRAIATFNIKPRLIPAKRNDPRTDFDYRSYRAQRLVCTLVIKQPDPRHNPQTVRVGRTLTSPAQHLGPRNSNIQPESEGRFVLTLVPDWMTRAMWKDGNYVAPIFSANPFPLDETDPDFTDEERATWNRLRRVCQSINSRIRSAGRRVRETYRFGESA